MKPIIVSRDALEAFWKTFAEKGPRHRNVARWVHVLGWKIAEGPMRAYLAPEMNTVH